MDRFDDLLDLNSEDYQEDNENLHPEDTKRCGRCHEYLPVSYYHKKHTKYGTTLQSYCIPCQKEYRESNPAPSSRKKKRQPALPRANKSNEVQSSLLYTPPSPTSVKSLTPGASEGFVIKMSNSTQVRAWLTIPLDEFRDFRKIITSQSHQWKWKRTKANNIKAEKVEFYLMARKDSRQNYIPTKDISERLTPFPCLELDSSTGQVVKLPIGLHWNDWFDKTMKMCDYLKQKNPGCHRTKVGFTDLFINKQTKTICINFSIWCPRSKGTS